MGFFIFERDFKIRNWEEKSLAIFKHVKWELWDSFQGSGMSFLTRIQPFFKSFTEFFGNCG